MVKLLVFNAAALAETGLAVWLLGIPMEEMLPFGWAFVPVLLLLVNAVFILYDLSMNGLIVFYIRRLHPVIGKYLK